MNFVDKDGTTKVYIPVHPWVTHQDRKHLFANMFFKLSRYGLVSISLQWSQVLMFHKK